MRMNGDIHNKKLKNKKMDEIGPWEDIDINNPYKHV
jgi:hypothetical protein